jgi:hypothetical protein
MSFFKNNTSLSQSDIELLIASESYTKLGTKTVICVLTLRNGFEVVGSSAPLVKENFDYDNGKLFARRNALQNTIDKVAYYFSMTNNLD